MLRVVAICVVAVGCHLIVAVDAGYLKNKATVEEFTSTQAQEESKVHNLDENQKDDNNGNKPLSVEEFTSTQVQEESKADDLDENQKDDNDPNNESSVEDLPNTQAPVKLRVDDVAENQTDGNVEELMRRQSKAVEDVTEREQSFCSRPPDIDGVISPQLEDEEYPVGTIVSYQCRFGYVSRSSNSLLSICRLNKRSGQTKWTPPNVSCIPRSCGDPGYVLNGRRIGNLFTFPSSVRFECLEGYKLQGLKDRYCQVSGEWSGKLPSCIPILCPVPSNPENGRVVYSSLEYGTELQYECDKGFTLQNHLPRICNEDEIWSNNEPECIETRCKIPEVPKHGSVQLSDEPKVGALAFYSCGDGTVLFGASTSKCLNSGDWTFDPPKCLSFCDDFAVQDGELGRYQRKNRYGTPVEFFPFQIGEHVRHNEQATLLCKDGYSPGNRTTGRSIEITCIDGAWSEHLHCHPMLCTGQPPSTKNGDARISSRVHGHSIWYQCHSGYRKVKGGKVVCKYGKWEGPTPICADYRCHTRELYYPGLIKPQVNFKHHGEKLVINCEKTYTVSPGKTHISCFQGKWDIESAPCIIKTCDEEPPLMDNGKPREFGRVNGSVVEYECLKDYEMEGYSSVHCEYGEWKGQPPVCKPAINNLSTSTENKSESNSEIVESLRPTFEKEECYCTFDVQGDILPAFPMSTDWREDEHNGRVKKGDRVSLICPYRNTVIVWPNGLKFTERIELICDTCQDWKVQDLPNCETIVPGDSLLVYHNQLKILPGGIIQVSKSERIFLTCTNAWVQPKWNVTHTQKIGIQENPFHVGQAYRQDIIIDEMDYEHVGRYECFGMNGHAKLGSVVIDLKISGFDILCPELSTETNVGSFEILYSNKRKINSTAHYKCKDPFKYIIGSNERICLENGKWSQSFPECEDIRCPLLNENSIFVITYSDSRKIFSTASYSCKNPHQKLVGTSIRRCRLLGWWSGTVPECEDITCPEFQTYNRLSVAYSRDRKVGSTANFTCLNQATLVGSSFSTCLHNGTWSHRKPSCEMLETHCPKLDGKGIFSIKYSNGTRVNSTATFFCKALNQKVAGCNFMTCQQSGEWSGEYPTCVDSVTCNLFDTQPNLKVYYTDGGRTGSIASFQCLPSTSLVGSSSATCHSNGTWSHLLPKCAAPNCSIDTLVMSLPEAVYPDMINITSEFVTPGSELSLICEDHLILTGSAKALCNFEGKWEFGDVQCVPACRVDKEETSHLIVEPLKDYYRFGENILLSCPPGLKLTSEVERMMCLGRDWSDTLPDCTEQITVLGFTQTTLKSG